MGRPAGTPNGIKLSAQDQLYRDMYSAQKSSAGYRNIPWKITFEDWLEWWGIDIHLRGNGAGGLCMCRYGDIGPYSLDNIYKDTIKNNSIYANHHKVSVYVGAKEYRSINTAALGENCVRQTVSNRCNSNKLKHSHWSWTPPGIEGEILYAEAPILREHIHEVQTIVVHNCYIIPDGK